jgi:hypothetical protein
MRWKKKMLLATGVMLVGGNVQAVPMAELKENYQSIIERNPFGLRPPPAPPTNNIAPPEPKAKVEVFLTGMTSIGFPKYPKQAFFYTREQGKKDVTHYALTEGGGKDGIEVLSIDTASRKVKIKMDNAETLLSFDTHGVPVQAVAAGRPIPGVPGAGGVPTLPVPGQPNFGRPGQPNYPAPLPAANSGMNYNAPGQPVYENTGQTIPQPMNTTVNQGSTGLRQIPSRRIRGGSRYNADAQVPTGPGGIGEGGPAMQQPAGDPAEEYVRAHLNQVARQREQPNIPVPPLPRIE